MCELFSLSLYGTALCEGKVFVRWWRRGLKGVDCVGGGGVETMRALFRHFHPDRALYIHEFSPILLYLLSKSKRFIWKSLPDSPQSVLTFLLAIIDKVCIVLSLRTHVFFLSTVG